MLNSSFYIGGNTNNQKSVVVLNTPSTGFMQKSNPMSRFIRFQRGSKMEDWIFPSSPNEKPYLVHKFSKSTYGRDSYEVEEKVNIIVLQICIFGNDYFLVEYVFEKDIE